MLYVCCKKTRQLIFWRVFFILNTIPEPVSFLLQNLRKITPLALQPAGTILRKFCIGKKTTSVVRKYTNSSQ